MASRVFSAMKNSEKSGKKKTATRRVYEITAAAAAQWQQKLKITTATTATTKNLLCKIEYS